MLDRNWDGIIFDLGGVILNIDYQATAKAFRELGLANFDEIYSQAAQSGLFDEFETGRISPQHFINKLLDHLPTGTTPNQVVHAWNAMLLDFPDQRLNLLQQLKATHRTFLLSNTNEIHIQAFHRKLEKTVGKASLDPYFEKVYFSSRIAQRKPHPEVFQRVCEEQGLRPSETLFIDDSIQHVEGAAKAGLQAVHLKPGMEVTALFLG